MKQRLWTVLFAAFLTALVNPALSAQNNCCPSTPQKQVSCCATDVTTVKAVKTTTCQPAASCEVQVAVARPTAADCCALCRVICGKACCWICSICCPGCCDDPNAAKKTATTAAVEAPAAAPYRAMLRKGVLL